MIMDKVRLLKALGDETKYKIIEFLQDKEKCVCEIFPIVNRSQSTVSIHLNNLEDLGALKSRREGKKIFYRIANPKIIKLMKLMDED
jgi:DNA-binding transcriptional ArsR family regulator